MTVQKELDYLVMLRDGPHDDSPWIVLSTGRGRSCQLFTLSGADAEAAQMERDDYEVRVIKVRTHLFLTEEETQRNAQESLLRRSTSVDGPLTVALDYSRGALNGQEGDTGHRETEPLNITKANPVSIRRVVPTAATARRNRPSSEAASD